MEQKTVEKILRYNAIFEPTPNGGFVITVPRLPGLVVEAETFEDGQRLTKEAITRYLNTLQKEGKAIPSPFEKSFTTPIDIKFPQAATPKPKKWLLILVILLIILGIAGGIFYLYQNKLAVFAPPPLGSPQPSAEAADPTADWEIYSNNEYSFKYPTGLKTDTGAAGAGYESIRVQYMGQKQIQSGRTQTSLFDGYAFIVTKVSSNSTKTSLQQAEEEQNNSKESCDSEDAFVSKISPVTVSLVEGYQYYGSCLGDYVSTFLNYKSNLYRLTQLYVGEEPEVSEYNKITDQILSTFKFLEDTSDWETLNSDQFNVRFKYPNDWKYIQNAKLSDTKFEYVRALSEQNETLFDSNGCGVHIGFGGGGGPTNEITSTTTTIDGKQFEKKMWSDKGKPIFISYISKEAIKGFELLYVWLGPDPTACQQTIDQILSTFQFTE